jgi:hypothetical protein
MVVLLFNFLKISYRAVLNRQVYNTTKLKKNTIKKSGIYYFLGCCILLAGIF